MNGELVWEEKGWETGLNSIAPLQCLAPYAIGQKMGWSPYPVRLVVASGCCRIITFVPCNHGPILYGAICLCFLLDDTIHAGGMIPWVEFLQVQKCRECMENKLTSMCLPIWLIFTTCCTTHTNCNKFQQQISKLVKNIKNEEQSFSKKVAATELATKSKRS